MQDQQQFLRWFTDLAGKPQEYSRAYIRNLPEKLVKSFLIGLDKHLEAAGETEGETADEFKVAKELLSNYAPTALKRFHASTRDYTTAQMERLQACQGTDAEELLAKITLKIKDSLIRIVKCQFEQLQMRMAIAENLLRIQELFVNNLAKGQTASKESFYRYLEENFDISKG